MDRGFILQATYRIEHGRPVVHLFGVTEEGESFVVRDTRTRPSFFLRTEDLPRAEPILEAARASGLQAVGSNGRPVHAADAPGPPAPGTAGTKLPHPPQPPQAFPLIGPLRWKTLDGAEAVEVFVSIPSDVPPLRERIRAVGIECHEADIPFVTRFLCDRRIRGAMGIEGPWKKGRRVRRIYEDVALSPDEFQPRLSILSLDIETDPQVQQIHSFALFGNLPLGGHVAEVHFVTNPGRADAPGSIETARGAGLCHEHKDEASLLRALLRRVREIDPDVLTGWNVIDFDLRVLERAFGRHGIPLHLGRADMQCRVHPRGRSWASSRATVHGRAVVDGLDLLRGAFIRLDQYTLDTAARTILGEGKTLAGDDRAGEIERLYREDLPKFLLYNLTDARLVVEILEKRDLVALAVRRSLLTGLPIDRVAGSIASFDFLYIGLLHREGVVAPSVRDAEAGGDRRRGQPAAIGGYVLESAPGIYENVWLFDYRSLYPSIIRTFHIDPLGHALAAGEEDRGKLIRAPNGAQFLRDGGVLPRILEDLFPRREEAKRRDEHVPSTAIKILMNSFYGVLATPHCRFFSTQVSNAITTFGREILLWTKARLEEMGYSVIYGDTDSVFAISGIPDPGEASEAGRKVVARLNGELSRWVDETHGVPSHLMLEFERLYLKFFMPSLRHGSEGSKKRYAGVVATPRGQELVFTGLESVRRDWTVLAKDFQRHLLMRVFEDQEPETFVLEFVRQLREGERDGDLIYRKGLRKPLDAYGKTTPPHVKAARLISGRPGRVISYVMTMEGPQPLGHITAPLDYDHYVEKQIRPVAESILAHVGKSFDEILGKGKQLGLL